MGSNQNDFPNYKTNNPIARKPLAYRCLALTGSFETGLSIPYCFSAIAGNFDGKGLSFGVLQWNFGQGTLQPLLAEMLLADPGAMKSIFGERLNHLQQALNSSQKATLEFAHGIQHPIKHFIFEPWHSMFTKLGESEQFRTIQMNSVAPRFKSAVQLCATFNLKSERAVALMFDIQVQNGGIPARLRRLIRQHIAFLPASLGGLDHEVQNLRVIANIRAAGCRPRWVADVLARKLCCAEGNGVVHGISYDLETDFGIGLRPFDFRRVCNDEKKCT